MSRQKPRRLRILFGRQNGKCWWCKCDMVLVPGRPGAGGNVCTLDHLYSRGDPRRGTDKGEATVAACWDCNNRRGNEHRAMLKAGAFHLQKGQTLTPQEEANRRRAVQAAKAAAPLSARA